MKISLELDMKKLIRDKQKDQYQEALLYYLEADGDTTFHNVKIKARVEFRKAHCRFPPIKLNFKKSEQEQEYFNDVNKLKLVTHCQKSTIYKQYLLKEYLVYRIYNLLSEKSFRVRLFIIEYKDSKGKMDPMENYGFIIESNSLLTSRLNSILVERENIPSWLTDPFQANLMAIFQYMIGNTDWAIPNLHNIRLVKSKDPFENPIAIPYDFDFCGMVNAFYAIPDESTGIKSVRTRLYRGYCPPSREDYQVYFQEFLNIKDEVYAMIMSFTLLEEKHQTEMLKYLDSFYNIIEDPRLAKIHLINACKDLPSR